MIILIIRIIGGHLEETGEILVTAKGHLKFVSLGGIKGNEVAFLRIHEELI